MLSLLDESTKGLLTSAPGGNKFQETAEYLRKQIIGEDYTDFLTT